MACNCTGACLTSGKCGVWQPVVEQTTTIPNDGTYYYPPPQRVGVCPGCGYCRCCGRYVGPIQTRPIWNEWTWTCGDHS